MISALKLTGIAIAIVLLLSITVKDRPLFSHIYEMISPATKSAQNATESFIQKSFSSTQTYSKKLFDNSVPKVKDSVKSKLSSSSRKQVAEPAERITEEEKAQLDDLIKNH